MDELLEILTRMHPEVDFASHMALIDECVLSSFDIVSLITEINDVFEVRVPPLDIVPENFNSAAALYALISRLTGE